MDFRILGPVEAWQGNRQLAIPGAKQQALLALLLLNANRVLSLDQLVDELWGDRPPATGRKAAQVRISQLRRAFESAGASEPVVVTRARGYTIELEDDQLDLHRFERLTREGHELLASGDAAAAVRHLSEALALWRGAPLSECDAPFTDLAAARLEELRLSALERRVDADLTLGRHADLVGELRELVGANPFRERPQMQLMLALYRSGRQAEALTAYKEARRQLVDDLGIEPSQAMQRLEQAILRQDPALEPPSPTAGGATASPTPDERRRSILVAPHDLKALEGLLQLAEALARRPRREIILAAVVEDSTELELATRALETARQARPQDETPVRLAAFTSEDRGADLVRLAFDQDVDLVLADATSALLDDGVPPPDLATAWRDAPCDVALLAAGTDRELVIEPHRAVIVPFGGGSHDWGALELGALIAAYHQAPLRLLGSATRPEAGKRDASRLLAGVSLIVQRAAGVLAEPLLVSPGEESVLAATREAGLLVVGLSDRWQTEGLGPLRHGLVRKAAPPVLIVRRGPGGLAPPERQSRYTWSVADPATSAG